MRTISSSVLIFVLCACSGQKDRIYSTESGAIAGYDPVAYFLNEMPVKGVNAFTCMWNGAMWYFSSEENKNLFEESPDSYVPQYGGYCAYAVSQGYTAKVDPNSWKIVD
ncbi:MAG: YHS domain-containing (seleno)protein, partial [Bacteroidota bacterium]